MANPVVHFEILGAESMKQELQDFYRATFGWEFQPRGPMEHGAVAKPEGEDGIGGSVDVSAVGPQVLIYISVDGIADYLERAKANGAEVVQDLTTIPGMVTYAQVRDPAGNVIGMVDSQTPEA